MTVIEKIISEYAKMRGVSEDVISKEVHENNEYTLNQLFKLACAFEACK